MNEIIKINYENAERPTVSGRELHETLGIGTEYMKWFERMCKYGFAEDKDYSSILTNRSDGQAGKPKTDHAITIGMAKEICMIQRTEKGKQCRQYFLDLEKAWNTPEMVIGRALQIAKKQIDSLKTENNMLSTTVAVQEQQISELKPKARERHGCYIRNMPSADTPVQRQAPFRLLTARNTQRCIHTGHKKEDCLYMIS